MTKNPFLSALFAITYIVCLVFGAIMAPRVFGGPEESILYPMIGLSVFVLSAAMMAYLFFYQPVLMLLDGRRGEAITFFFKTLGTFALLTALLLATSIFVRG